MYTQSDKEDRFYVRLSEKEMDTLFANGLKMIMHDGKFLMLTINVDVADHQDSQISPRRRIEQAVTRQRSKPDKYMQTYMCLNLNSFGQKLTNMCVSLASECAFQLLCDTILRYTDLCRDFQNNRLTGIRLSNNNIKSLAPLAKLSKLNFKLLDLTSNEIESLNELNHLKNFNLERLNIANNSVVGLRSFELKIREVLPDLKFLVSFLLLILCLK